MKTSREGGFDYALVSGHGRSGTNWLLELFDLSPRTFCRNEPAGIETSPLKKLEWDRFIRRADQTALEEGWDDAVSWTCSHMGERDRVITMPKDHMHAWSRSLGLYRIARGPRYRRALGHLIPSLRGAEWPAPAWVFDRARLAQALPVLKLVSSPGWSDWVLRRRPTIGLFHIVRHPGGYLHSWTTRYRSKHDEETIHRLNRARLEDIAAEEPEWGARFGSIDAMGTEESELWFWCYATETIEAAGRGRPAYDRIIYEDLTSDPVPIVRRCYEKCRLAWSRAIERAVLDASRTSQTIAGAWRESLDEGQIELVSRILDQSSLRECWKS